MTTTTSPAQHNSLLLTHPRILTTAFPAVASPCCLYYVFQYNKDIVLTLYPKLFRSHLRFQGITCVQTETKWLNACRLRSSLWPQVIILYHLSLRKVKEQNQNTPKRTRKIQGKNWWWEQRLLLARRPVTNDYCNITHRWPLLTTCQLQSQSDRIQSYQTSSPDHLSYVHAMHGSRSQETYVH